VPFLQERFRALRCVVGMVSRGPAFGCDVLAQGIVVPRWRLFDLARASFPHCALTLVKMGERKRISVEDVVSNVR